MSEKKETRNLEVLLVGVDPSVHSKLQAVIGLSTSKYIACDPAELLEPVQNTPDFVLCGAPREGVSIVEVAQLLRMHYSNVPIYLILEDAHRADRKGLIKNGFTDVFFLPLDFQFLTKTISETVQRIRKQGILFRSVKLIDIEPGTALDFDTYVYLPANSKHVRYSAAGDELDAARAERLRHHQVASLFVNENGMPKFYAYTAEKLRALGKNPSLSETEKSERLQGAVRDLISSLFSDTSTGTDTGKKIAEDCRNIVKSYVMATEGNDWYAKLLAATTANGADNYSHAAETSSYAALFGMAAGLNTIEELAMAGLIHDIGLSMVPTEILAKDQEAWTEQERAEYAKHPEYSLAMIRDRKLVLPDLVHKIIIQHHEKFSGQGYPKGLAGDRICAEAQILFFADLFSERMFTKPGTVSPDPRKVILELTESIRKDPGSSPINPKLFEKIAALFPKSEDI